MFIATCLKNRARTLFVCALVGVVCGSCGESSEEPAAIEETPAECTRDASTDPASAEALSLGSSVSGFICPQEDQDWFSFEMPATDRLLEVSLGIQTLGGAAAISPIEPTYAVWELENGEPTTVVAQPSGNLFGESLDFVHCVDPGKSYAFVVRDEGDDAQDFRRSYMLAVNSKPDPDSNEPNEDMAGATPLAPNTTVVGAIACRGDEDWYSVNIPAGVLVRMNLISDVATYEPQVRLFNMAGELQAEGSNLSGSVTATNIDLTRVGLEAGNYVVVVSDDNGEQADPNVSYALLVEFINDADPNEPNDHPSEATPLAAEPITCAGGGWSQTFEIRGTIGSPGDNDWYSLPLNNCSGDLVEAEMVMNNSGLSNTAQWEFNSRVQSTLALVRPHNSTPCQDDESCTALNKTCDDQWDCAGLFNNCLSDNFCAGATACLPVGVCGALQTQRSYTCNPNAAECQPSADNPPPPNQAIISAPSFIDDNVMYLRASDFQSDGSAPDTTYTLKVRVRAETDGYEPSNLYANELPNETPINRMPIKDIPVHDCTEDDCCGSDTWIEGSISYENDEDFFQYPHPCPGEDCTVRVLYDVDAGPVDFVMSIHRGSPLWFTMFDNEERAMQSARSGALGGDQPNDSCFYAFQGHNGDPFMYRVSVRDLFALYPGTTIVRPSSRDWDAEQRYRFCVEKIANGCVSPCVVSENGECNTP